MQILHVQCDREAYVNCKPSINIVNDVFELFISASELFGHLSKIGPFCNDSTPDAVRQMEICFTYDRSSGLRNIFNPLTSTVAMWVQL